MCPGASARSNRSIAHWSCLSASRCSCCPRVGWPLLNLRPLRLGSWAAAAPVAAWDANGKTKLRKCRRFDMLAWPNSSGDHEFSPASRDLTRQAGCRNDVPAFDTQPDALRPVRHGWKTAAPDENVLVCSSPTDRQRMPGRAKVQRYWEGNPIDVIAVVYPLIMLFFAEDCQLLPCRKA
jgi:hypothetical protein